MTIFSANNLAKSVDRGPLFSGVSFGMEAGERLGIIGRNGVGKTSLLDIIAGLDAPDEGNVVFNKQARFEYLTQNPDFAGDDLVLGAVMKTRPLAYETLHKHSLLCSQMQQDYDEKLAKQIDKLNQILDQENGWNLETEAKAILTKLGITDYNKPVSHLSGGLKKRVALARALLSNPDLLILDEPTNHLDADSVQWLQDRLLEAGTSLLLVTHDRYFLDAVSTRIVEIDQQRIYNYPGNYESYLEKKEEILQVQNSTIEHKKTQLRAELAWLQRGARARRSKAKGRRDWIAVLKEQTKKKKEKKIKIELGKTFLGKRIIDAHYISKTIAGKLLFKDYLLVSKPGDRIGIIGPNGSGKSTLLNVLSGRMPNDEGNLIIGPSINIGFFTQESLDLDPGQTVLGSLKEIAEFIDVGFGRDRYLSCKDLLRKFLFPDKQHSSFISTLSGGEKRRLGLLRVLMGNPNVLFLDEPTNDLDIQTLNSLETYLDDFYGVLIVVSHDRAFLDRTVEFIHAFDGKGNVKEYPGNYSYYLEVKETAAAKAPPKVRKEKPSKPISSAPPKKLSYKDQREYDMLESEIPELEERKARLEEYLGSGLTDYKELEDKSNELKELEEEIELKTLRWMELEEITEG